MIIETETLPTETKPFEWFELCIALLLGLGAIGASLSGYESGLWNGKTTEYFTKSASLTTLAAADEHKAMMMSMHDASIDLEAKKLIAEAQIETNSQVRQSQLQMASSLYLRHLSDAAYEDLGLQAAARASAGRETVIATDVLTQAGNRDLDEKYMHQVFAAAEADREKAKTDFDIGGHASSEGDRFALAEVLFAVSLFISGTSLVFKTRLRWLFASVGAVALLSAAGYLGHLEWM